jgi:hypothetical protein
MSCELRFHGESYGWEIQFLERGEFLYGHGAFATRAGAVDWAQRSASGSNPLLVLNAGSRTLESD